MSEPTGCAAACRDDLYCSRCDVLVGLDGFHVVEVAERDDGEGPALRVVVETPMAERFCPRCGVAAQSHGRRQVRLIDAPCFGRPVVVWWRKRIWRCAEPACPGRAFTEQDGALAAPRGLLTRRAGWWAIGQLRREHASVAGLARQLGTSWKTVWRTIRPLLQALADDPARFDGVTTLGVDEHIWHHRSTRPPEQGGRGPKELTGMVDLSRDPNGHVKTRLLDLVPGRSGKAYADWLAARNDSFRQQVKIATLDPFHGYKNAIDDQLEDSIAVLDAFHVVKLGSDAVDACRRRVQQQLHRHRGRRDDPLYRIRNLLRTGQERLTQRQAARLDHAFGAHDQHVGVEVAWRCAQQLRSAYRATSLAEGRKIAEQVVVTFPGCPVPEIARLGRTLRKWKAAFLAYFDTDRSSNGGTEAVNGLIELHRRIARGFRNKDSYRLRMLLIGGGLDGPRPT